MKQENGGWDCSDQVSIENHFICVVSIISPSFWQKIMPCDFASCSINQIVHQQHDSFSSCSKLFGSETEIWNVKKNKMVSYHRHTLHLPTFVRLLKRWKCFFLERRSFIIFSIFSNFENFQIFCQENFIIRAEGTFVRNRTIWNPFYSKLATFSDFEKIQVFPRNTHLFFQKKNPNFWTFWEISLFQSYFAANFLKFGGKKLTFRNVKEHRERNWQTSSKKPTIWMEDLSPILYKYGANNKGSEARDYEKFECGTSYVCPAL